MFVDDSLLVYGETNKPLYLDNNINYKKHSMSGELNRS